MREVSVLVVASCCAVTFLLDPVETTVRVNITFPEGWEVLDFPPACTNQIDGYETSANWTICVITSVATSSLP